MKVDCDTQTNLWSQSGKGSGEDSPSHVINRSQSKFPERLDDYIADDGHIFVVQPVDLLNHSLLMIAKCCCRITISKWMHI